MTDNRTSAFADALQRFEQDHDLATFAAVFTEDAEMSRPERQQTQPNQQDVSTFWLAYLEQFHDIRSDFHRIAEGGNLGELEWESTGTLESGQAVSYTGVSLLTFNDEGKVTRFATYYDTSALAIRAA
jgi:ketosteroid isomerase-like protein